jgi:hypothetical protein
VPSLLVPNLKHKWNTGRFTDRVTLNTHLESWPVVQEQCFLYEPGLYSYILVHTSMYSYVRNFKVHTGMYWVHTKTKLCISNTNRVIYSVLEYHRLHDTHTQYRFRQSFDTKKHYRKYISAHGTYQYKPGHTLFIPVYTCSLSCNFLCEGGTIIIPFYHHLLVPISMYHLL